MLFFAKEQARISQKQKKMKQHIEKFEQILREQKSSSSSDSEENIPIAVPKVKILPPPVTSKSNRNEGKSLTLNANVTLLSPLQAGLKQAIEQGERHTGYVLQGPVFEARINKGILLVTTVPFHSNS